MPWTVNTVERYGNVNRVPRIQPYLPARSELLGNATRQGSAKDIGKAVKYSDDTMVICADGDQIVGFVESVEAGTWNGHSVAGVLCDPGLEALCTDEVGNIAVGDLVVAGTAVAFGTQCPTNGANVKVRTGSTVSGQSALLSSGALAIGSTSKKALKNASTIVALVGGVVVTKTTAETALSGTVAADKFNVFALFVNASGTLSAVMGTAGDTLADVVIPQANATRAMVGMVIVNPTGTGNFVGGTTDLDDATVVPNAVYVNTLGAVAQADQVVGIHNWECVAVYGSGAGRQIMVRKV